MAPHKVMLIIKYSNSINQPDCVGWLIKAGFPSTVSYDSFNTKENTTVRYDAISFLLCKTDDLTTVNF